MRIRKVNTVQCRLQMNRGDVGLGWEMCQTSGYLGSLKSTDTVCSLEHLNLLFLVSTLPLLGSHQNVILHDNLLTLISQQLAVIQAVLGGSAMPVSDS